MTYAIIPLCKYVHDSAVGPTLLWQSDRRISVRGQWESIQNGCKTSNDVGLRCGDMGSEERTREVGCGGN